MKPLRFLMLNWRDTENPLAGGAERVTLRHMAELVRRGHEVVWFANHFEGAERETAIDGIRIIRGGGRGTSILHARRCCREHGPFDLVIDQHHGLPWFAHWWSGTNCVAYIHEVLGPIWRAFYRWPTSAIGQAQERFFQRLYAGVPFWTVSESTRQQLLAHGARDVRVWPNGTDTEPLPTLPAKRLGAPLRLIALARLAPNKRVDHVVRALALLLRTGLRRGADHHRLGTGPMAARGAGQRAWPFGCREVRRPARRCGKKCRTAKGAPAAAHIDARRLGAQCDRSQRDGHAGGGISGRRFGGLDRARADRPRQRSRDAGEPGLGRSSALPMTRRVMMRCEARPGSGRSIFAGDRCCARPATGWKTWRAEKRQRNFPAGRLYHYGSWHHFSRLNP